MRLEWVYFKRCVSPSKLECQKNSIPPSFQYVYFHVFVINHDKIGIDYLCSTPFSTIFQLYYGSQFYWWRKQSTRWKPMANFITSSFICYGQELNHKFSGETHRLDIQWNLSNPTHQGTWEMSLIVQDVRTCLILHTKAPGKCVWLYRMSEPV